MPFRSTLPATIASWCVCVCLFACHRSSAWGETPLLESVFPPGGRAGSSTVVSVTGSGLGDLQTLRCSGDGVQCRLLAPGQFQIDFPPHLPPGLYDVWGVGAQGVSTLRALAIGLYEEAIETEPNNSPSSAQLLTMNCVNNGRISKPGDVDYFVFEATAGQPVVIECWAERLDSRLRAVIELYDAQGRRIAVNRGYFGIDPLVHLRAPEDGRYLVKLTDLAASGSDDHYYRLQVGSHPRVAFTVPSVVARGKPAKVTFFGWNLAHVDRATVPSVTPAVTPGAGRQHDDWDQATIELPAQMTTASWPWPTRVSLAQGGLDGFTYSFPGSDTTTWIGVTDLPVVQDVADNHSALSAQTIDFPVEISGQLTEREEQDWYAIDVSKGEVLHLEAVAQRIHSPVDLRVTVTDATGQQPLLQLDDDVENLGSNDLPTQHLDAVGRWVAPADGPYRIVVEDLYRSSQRDPRRIYRLSIRREEPDFQVVAVPHLNQPGGLNIARGGGDRIDLIAFRRRGFRQAIQVCANGLPAGFECPDVWIGPESNRGVAIIRASHDVAVSDGQVRLEASGNSSGFKPVRAATVVRTGFPDGWGRLTSAIPLAVNNDPPLRMTANCHEPLNHHLYGLLPPRHAPGGIVDVHVQIDRTGIPESSEIQLIAVGLPPGVDAAVAVLPAGKNFGYVSLYLPPNLPIGPYSFAVRGEYTEKMADNSAKVRYGYSNSLKIDVESAAFVVELDPFAPRYGRRGGAVRINYTAKRKNGFIGKVHTELAAPGVVMDVPGLRGRGVTAIGQSEAGSMQVVINPDASLGRQPFLRLLAIGVVEDEPVYQGATWVPLEILEQEDNDQ
ncbi:MAG: hypothetical protein O2931_15730 [Planctomycetota bacterium]|nr:hypothetical protein [Planctomycetota bacterium]MDA1180233.1 hypothetical protein [Planctomycetota bacterium]